MYVIKEREVIKIMMCDVKLSTCGSAPKIEIEINHITWEKASAIVAFGMGYFRDVRVCDDETGEILYSRYVAEDVFEPEISYFQFGKLMGEVLGI
jgi:hypothetical protein